MAGKCNRRKQNKYSNLKKKVRRTGIHFRKSTSSCLILLTMPCRRQGQYHHSHLEIRKLKLRGAGRIAAFPYTGYAISCRRKHSGLVWTQSQVQHSASVACGKKER